MLLPASSMASIIVTQVLITQARRDGGVPKVVHRLDQIADTGDLTACEVSQIVNANALPPNPFCRSHERVTKHLAYQVTTAASWREQKRISVSVHERI